MEYNIFSRMGQTFGQAQSALLNDVNDDIKEGWKPIGGICLTQDIITKRCYASQAMIKEI